MSESTVPNALLNPPLDIVDIDNAIKVIDYAADQGAYKSWAVIEQVQLVRNRLLAVVAAVQASQTVNTPNT